MSKNYMQEHYAINKHSKENRVKMYFTLIHYWHSQKILLQKLDTNPAH